ncbi:MAG: hypothetical protein KJO35_02725 [Gammaproteobacteria bacterium]|nr:hypothetical protein [Gammaproteobacteria bacterium]
MKIKTLVTGAILLLLPYTSFATVVGFGPTVGGVNDCVSGAVVACQIAPDQAPIPNPVTQNPNDGILLIWNELQNFTLTQDLRVDRVADPDAPFVQQVGNDFLIVAGTVVSSHYIQWDPGAGSESRVDTSILFDSEIFAFLTDDQNLFDSDYLGVPGIDYNDFGLRGLESGDTTVFGTDLSTVDISWSAGSPGDWTRGVTAFSPSAVPVPAALPLMAGALGVLGLLGRKRRRI